GAPAPDAGDPLVDAAPAETRLERLDVLQAFPAVGARRAAYVVAGHPALAPGAVLELEARAAGDAELRVGVEGGQQVLEEVGQQGDVGVELEHDVGPLGQRGEAGLEGGDVPAHQTALDEPAAVHRSGDH